MQKRRASLIEPLLSIILWTSVAQTSLSFISCALNSSQSVECGLRPFNSFVGQSLNLRNKVIVNWFYSNQEIFNILFEETSIWFKWRVTVFCHYTLHYVALVKFAENQASHALFKKIIFEIHIKCCVIKVTLIFSGFQGRLELFFSSFLKVFRKYSLYCSYLKYWTFFVEKVTNLFIQGWC